MEYVEDYLEHYVEVVGVTDSNKQILTSINRQIKKGNALTDRQYDLIKRLMLEQLHLGFDGNEPLRTPLRHIDRSKYIKIVSTADVYGQDKVHESHKSKWKWIKIRFPFSKKTIVQLDSLAHTHRKMYYHEKGSHEHYFKLCSSTVHDICDVFCKKEFEIDDELLDLRAEIAIIKQDPKKYVPGYWDGEITNVSSKIKEHLDGSWNRYHLIDRKRNLGLTYITGETPSGIIKDIVTRDFVKTTVKPSMYSLSKVVDAIYDLKRFPVLVCVDPTRELDQMSQAYKEFDRLVPRNKQTALFRVESNDDYNANTFIKDNNLNNWLDKQTEVVYICKNKLPKLLLKTDWKPQCVLNMTSGVGNRHLNVYQTDICDLVLNYDEHESIFGDRFGNL